MLVCGDPDIKLAKLKAHTTYHGFPNEHHATCRRFWRVMDSFTQDDRSKFLRFTWGRSRLPREAKWDKPFKLTKKNSDTDDVLPIAHTCFFQLELPSCVRRMLALPSSSPPLSRSFRRVEWKWSPPFTLRPPSSSSSTPSPRFADTQPRLHRYSSDEVMRQRLLAAVHYGCGGEFMIK